MSGHGIATPDEAGFAEIVFGAVTGTAGLRPAPPSSVDPRGIPARPTDDADTGDPEAVASPAVAQEADAPPETPPPSNGAPEDDLELPEAAQFVTPGMEPALDRGAVGLMPGVAISVDPSGIPTGGTVEPGSKLSGDVAPTPDGDCSPVAIACAPARLHPKPVKADAHNAKATSGSNRSGREKLILILKGGLGMCGSPDISSTEG